MRTLKKISLLLGFCIGLAPVCMAQKAGLEAIAGPKGIWIICGDKLPKDFSYIISRKKDNGDWVKVAEVSIPRSMEQIQADVINTERIAGMDIAPLNPARLQAVWERISAVEVKDSPAEIQNNLPLRSATGTAWYDAEADSTSTYRYKVQQLNKNGAGDGLITNIIKYPVSKFATTIRPALINPIKDGIYVEFEVQDAGQMTTCKVLRSYYLRSGFEQISATPLFMKRKDKLFITFTDNSAVEKIPYTYVILPIDAAGNKGFASPEIKAFNVIQKSIVPSVHQFKAQSDETEKAIKLSWKLDNTMNITTIDIYKSDKYDGNYRKLASVAPADTTYFDHSANPIVTYFYTIKLNGMFEGSPASPRIPGILKASDKNLLPPQNIQLRQDSDKVILTWEKTEQNTHAYYVYRAIGRNSEMKQLGPAIVTDSNTVSYVDVLPVNAKPMVYTYTVADENTSYVIGPKSLPLYAYTMGLATLPIPHSVAVREIADGKVMVIWPDMQEESANFSGYMLYRRVKTPNGKTTAPQQVNKLPIPTGINHFTDSIGNGAAEYYYSVRTVGENEKKLSSPSLEAGYTVYQELPQSVSNIRVVPSANTVILSWNNPLGDNIQNIQIFRALEGEKPKQIVTLAGDKQTYTDKDVAVGNSYYYTFSVRNSKGVNSNTTDMVGVRVK